MLCLLVKTEHFFICSDFTSLIIPWRFSAILSLNDVEKNGYKFLRNDQNQRLFVENDFVVLRYFQQLVQANNVPLG
jgi:hypothetical protein